MLPGSDRFHTVLQLEEQPVFGGLPLIVAEIRADADDTHEATALAWALAEARAVHASLGALIERLESCHASTRSPW